MRPRNRNEGRRAPEEQAPSAGTAPAGRPDPHPSSGGRPLGELLVDRGLLTGAQVDEALLHQPTSGKRLGVLLVELGAVGERDLYEVLSIQLGLPLIDLRQEQPEADALALLRALTGVGKMLDAFEVTESLRRVTAPAKGVGCGGGRRSSGMSPRRSNPGVRRRRYTPGVVV